LKGEAARKEIENGCDFIAVGIDSTLLAEAAKRALESAKG
jgi:2-keto-3-deoxy-L-rhamnonate aldolase RhmA